ncbi:hypothetical protein GF325_15615, partial [Candidatus Bathyarchaeota archaeon]|nr:hypothetical protein [Candidatus Bathyarchaeota archaeon]
MLHHTRGVSLVGILAITDLHGAWEHLDAVIEAASALTAHERYQVDHVFFLGDLGTSEEEPREQREMARKLGSVLHHAFDVPIYALPGNRDYKVEVNEGFEEGGIHLLERKPLACDGWVFIGIGGCQVESNPRYKAGGGYYLWGEGDDEILRLREMIEKHEKDSYLCIVSHQQPHNTVFTLDLNRKANGSTILRRVLMHHRPEVWMLGHMHHRNKDFVSGKVHECLFFRLEQVFVDPDHTQRGTGRAFGYFK